MSKVFEAFKYLHIYKTVAQFKQIILKINITYLIVEVEHHEVS